MRTIRIIGEINEKAFSDFCEELDDIEQTNDVEALIELCSTGGEAYTALAFVSRMRISPIKFTIQAHGYVASAAVLILACGTRRQMTQEAWVMVHEDSVVLNKNSSVALSEVEVAQYRRLENQWDLILDEKTNKNAAFWDKLHRRTAYLSPEQCLKVGLIDEII